MNRHIARTTLGITLCSMLLGVAQAAPQAGGCSTSDVAGLWGYTSTGTIVSPSVGSFVAVGRVTLTVSGTFSGAQTTSVAGSFFEETVQGTYTVNSDCTGGAIVYVYHGTTLARTTGLHLVWDDHAQEMRAIFLTSGTAITLVGRKISRDEEED